MSDQEYSGPESDPSPSEGAPSEPEPAPESTPPPPPPVADEGDSGTDNKGLMLVLSYLWILALIPLLVEKDSEVQWHAKNGLVWTIAEFLMHMVILALNAIFWVAGCFLTPVVWIGWLVVRVMAIMKALKGERMELPVLADFVDKF